MGKNNSIVEDLLDNASTTSVADETATRQTITVKGKSIEYYRDFCNVRVADEDLPKFQQFVGKPNYSTFSVAVALDPREDNVKGVEFVVSLDDNGFPQGFNQELHNVASYRRRQQRDIAYMNAQRHI